MCVCPHACVCVYTYMYIYLYIYVYIYIYIYIRIAPEQAPNEVSGILQHYYTALSQALIYPVQVSQLLYSERCISETTLDEVETLENSLNDKKIALLTAISTTVSSDHRKLKMLATTLNKFEEMRSIAHGILSECGKN